MERTIVVTGKSIYKKFIWYGTIFVFIRFLNALMITLY